jgi:hypothetical protein
VRRVAHHVRELRVASGHSRLSAPLSRAGQAPAGAVSMEMGRRSRSRRAGQLRAAQVMQVAAAGRAARRAGLIGAPHRSQMP